MTIPVLQRSIDIGTKRNPSIFTSFPMSYRWSAYVTTKSLLAISLIRISDIAI